MDVLIDKIIEKKPSVIGLDPRPEYIPHIMKKHISKKAKPETETLILSLTGDLLMQYGRLYRLLSPRRPFTSS